jgi:hypothetical protein
MIACYSCVFNNKLEDKCEKLNTEFFAKFGRNCPDYKEEGPNQENIEP